MIHNFKVENYYSINQMQELDFTTNKKYSDSYTAYNNYFINNINCFVGANASGKTNLFKALSFVIWFAEESYYGINHETEDVLSPHKLQNGKPSKFEIIFDYNNNLYKYFVEMTQEKVLYECLEIKKTRGFTYIYKLSNKENKINIQYNRNKTELQPINKYDEKRFKAKNRVSFFSFLVGLGYLNIKITNFEKMMYSNVSFPWSRTYDQIFDAIALSKVLRKSKKIKEELLPFLKCFDYGITDFAKDGLFKVKNYNNEYVDILGFKHSGAKQSFAISAAEESAGTIKGTFLLIILLAMLSNGGIAVIDELDVRLHFDIARKLISLFANKETNPKNAQLFFSTHQPLFLNDRDKTQIFLCYKEDYLNTDIYRLDEINGIRNTENFFEKYLSGEYGATPRIGKC